MKNLLSYLGICLAVIIVLVSCKKQSETLVYPTVSQFYPLQVGKMFLYRLDSTVPVNFNKVLQVKSYHALDSVESEFTDNTGRTSYRIYRYLRDTADLQPWTYSNTYVAVMANNQIEYVEDNLRFIKLHNPVANDFSWKGNSYFETDSLYINFKDWDYTYQGVNDKFSISGITYDSTATVLQKDDFSPNGREDLTLPFQQRDYSVEVYSKSIGLVYKDLIHWNWQRPVIDNIGTLGAGSYSDGAYGIRLTLIGHN